MNPLRDLKPPLDIQVILWEKNKFVQSPRWLFVQDFDGTDYETLPLLQLICYVCHEMKKEKFELVDLTLKSLSARDILQTTEQIVSMPRERIRDNRTGLVAHYWSGQCAHCKVIYWYARAIVGRCE